MSTYKPGIRTKKALIESAKKLFYQRGYEGTSVKNICDMADVPHNSITYHFKGKDQLALIIFNELSEKIFDFTRAQIDKELFEKKPYLEIMISYMAWWQMIFEEPQIRRFIKELYINRIAQEGFFACSEMGGTGRIYPFFNLYEQSFGKTFDMEYRNILRSAFLGVENELLIGYDIYFRDRDMILKYLLKTRLTNFEITEDEFNNIYEECMCLFKQLELNMKWFEDFAYIS